MGKKLTKRQKRARADKRPTQKVWLVKLGVALALDFVDFTIGRLFGFGVVSNLLLTLIGIGMFGWRGLFHLLEMADPTHQLDGFVPTLTLIALAERPK